MKYGSKIAISFWSDEWMLTQSIVSYIFKGVSGHTYVCVCNLGMGAEDHGKRHSSTQLRNLKKDYYSYPIRLYIHLLVIAVVPCTQTTSSPNEF